MNWIFSTVKTVLVFAIPIIMLPVSLDCQRFIKGYPSPINESRMDFFLTFWNQDGTPRNLNSRLDSIREFNADGTALLSRSSDYFYDEACKVDSASVFPSGESETFNRYYYNNDGQVSKISNFSLSDNYGDKESWYSYEYKNNDLIEERSGFWSSEYTFGGSSVKYVNHLDSLGRLVLRDREASAFGSTWTSQNNFQLLFNYDSLNRVSEYTEISRSWGSGSGPCADSGLRIDTCWVYNTYDLNGLLIQVDIVQGDVFQGPQEYPCDSNVISSRNNLRKLYTYDGQQRLVEELLSENISDSLWVNVSLKEYRYDLNEEQELNFEFKDNVWDTTRYLLRLYNDDGFPVQIRNLLNQREKSYYYSSHDNILECESKILSDFELYNDFKIYPNPATDLLIIDNSRGLSYDFDIIDQLGQVVISGNNQSSIQLSGIPEGLYYLRLRDDLTKGLIIKKFVKS